MAAGCGPNSIQFEVKTDKKLYLVPQPEAAKAVVYIFRDEITDNIGDIGEVTTRVGIDGSWVGANGNKSYFFFTLTPGDHRICTERQSDFKSGSKSLPLRALRREAGKVYYFRTYTPDQPLPGEAVEVVRIDPAQAQLLIHNRAQHIHDQKGTVEHKTLVLRRLTISATRGWGWEHAWLQYAYLMMTNSAPPFIELRNVSVVRSGRVVLHELNLRIEAGETS